MSEISFKLKVFEGPLELLLHLIAKHKLNINDIPIAELLDQYMEYIGEMTSANMEIAGDFLEMAAQLIYIKTMSLLPQHEEAEQMKKELQGRLIELSMCKAAAENMRERYIGDTVTVRKPIKLKIDSTYTNFHSTDELIKAYSGITVREDEKRPVKAEAFSKLVSRKFVSVTSKIIFVLRRLYSSGKVSTGSLFEGMTDNSERVATFLAVLELTKSGRIFLNDDNTEITFNRTREVI